MCGSPGAASLYRRMASEPECRPPYAPVSPCERRLGTRCAGDLYLPETSDPVPGLVLGHSGVMVKEALAFFAPTAVASHRRLRRPAR